MTNRAGAGGRRLGFTLIELLVVIAIIALLISILLPALGQARASGRMAAEMGGLQQITRSYHNYAGDNKGNVIPPYMHWAWAHPPNPDGTSPYGTSNRCGRIDMRASDDRRSGEPANTGAGSGVVQMEGYVVKSWPWRLYPYMTDVKGLMYDPATLADFRSRPAPEHGYDTGTTYQRAVSWHPSWGINGIYVGGDHMNAAFNSSTGLEFQSGAVPRFWVKNLADARDPSKLITFASTRARDVNGSNNIVPGHYLAPPPRPHPYGRLAQTIQLSGGWYNRPNNTKWNPRLGPEYWGEGGSFPPGDALGMAFGLDFRHFSKSLTSALDGHAESLNIEQMTDMRRWANKATTPNWNFVP